MSFFFTKYIDKKSLVFLLIIISVLLSVTSLYAQVILLPEDTTTAPIFNDYFEKFDKVPQKPVLATNWYRLPKEIAPRIDLSVISPATRYFEDDGTPYLEKTIDGIKGRLFLKELIGSKYRILDLQFVPYLDAESLITDNDVSIDEPQLVVSDEDQVKDDSKDKDDASNFVVPLFAQRDTGHSIVVDVILVDSTNNPKRNALYRYDREGNHIYQESYVYTSRGAIQRLTREYENGSLERFIYYFTTGGLKEVFYQNPDKSTYLLSYTLSGNLLEKIIHDSTQRLAFELHNTYDDYDSLILTIESDYNVLQEIESVFENNNLLSRTSYLLQEKISEVKDPAELEQFASEDLTNPEINTSIENEEQSDIVQLNDTDPQTTDVDDDTQSDDILIEDQITDVVEEVEVRSVEYERIILFEEFFTYDESGNEIGSKRIEALNEYTKEVSYEDEKTIESYYKNGLLMYKETIEGSNSKVVYFFEGNPILNIYYNKNSKVKEEIIFNGEVVETRNIN